METMSGKPCLKEVSLFQVEINKKSYLLKILDRSVKQTKIPYCYSETIKLMSSLTLNTLPHSTIVLEAAWLRSHPRMNIGSSSFYWVSKIVLVCFYLLRKLASFKTFLEQTAFNQICWLHVF